MKTIKKHFRYYFSLILILGLGLLLTVSVGPNAKLQGIIIMLTIMSYILWGIIHHLLSHELTVRIVIEYVLIGTLGLSVLFFVIVGGL